MRDVFLRIFAWVSCSVWLFAFPCGASAQGELFTVRVPLERGRQARVEQGGVSVQVGQVLSTPVRPLYPAFGASRWGKVGTVVASAVNAVHILVGLRDGRGSVVSLIPSYTTAPASRPFSAVVVDGVGGSGLFGLYCPPVGTPVAAVLRDGSEAPLDENTLKDAVEIRYRVAPPVGGPLWVDLENRLGGRVEAVYPSGSKVIGEVVHPVSGIGFFEGSHYQGVGRIRANHPGVVCVSTSPPGEMGGFQIVPEEHARSHEMKPAWYEPQWLIVRSMGGGASPGARPLFSGYLTPGPSERDFGGGFLENLSWASVKVRILDGEWQDMPKASSVAEGVFLKDVTHIRILYPSFSGLPLLGGGAGASGGPDGASESLDAGASSLGAKDAAPKVNGKPKPAVKGGEGELKPDKKGSGGSKPRDRVYDQGAPEPEYF
ncbi:MAG: hypothetical protein N2315_02210 [Thermanaerothrix sp.]|nr:hypothetical protein [Thermanaerothrix sp.]